MLLYGMLVDWTSLSGCVLTGRQAGETAIAQKGFVKTA